MKTVKSVLSLLLCIALCAGFIVPAYAVNEKGITFSVDAPSLEAKDEEQTVEVTVSASEGFQADTIEFSVVVPDGWSVTSVAGDTITYNSNNLKYNWYDSLSENVDFASTIATITYTVPANADDAVVGITGLTITSDYGTEWESGVDVTTTLTITDTPAADGYTAGLTTTAANNEVVSGGTVTVNVGVSHSSDAVFNAGEIKLSYDSTKLTPDTDYIENTLKLSWKIENAGTANAVLAIEDFGSDKTMPYTYSIPFTAAEVSTETTGTVTLTRAAFILKDNANSSDLIEAAKSPESLTVTIKVAMVNVTLTNSSDNTSTTTTTQKGVAYTFAPTDTANYTYSDVSATVDGQPVSFDEGTWTIPGTSVTGNIVITYTKTAKSYDVTTTINDQDGNQVSTSTTENGATYNNTYEFTVPADEPAGTDVGYTYALTSVTINGIAYTGYSCAEGTRDYTIPGTDITGDIVITITKTEQPANTFTVGVDGTGAGNATIDNVGSLVAKGGTASITVTPEDGYTYTVTAKMGNADATVNKSGNTYTVANVSANVTFTVTKTLDVSTVSVTNYIQVDSYVVWLVTYDGTLAAGKVPTYDGKTMYWSDKYDAYCWLVIDSTLTVDAAKTKVDAATGTKVSVDYGMDINGTGVTDAADAQLVWNMYNAMYNDNFTSVKMDQFLAADQNATSDANWGLNVQDAQVIITAILAGNATT